MKHLGLVIVALASACGNAGNDGEETDTSSSATSSTSSAASSTHGTLSGSAASDTASSTSTSASSSAASGTAGASTSGNASTTSSSVVASSSSSTAASSSSSGPGVDLPAARRAYLASAAAYEVPATTSALMVDAVYTASIVGANGQQILTTGTLTQMANGQVSYGATPSDRLRVVYNTGAVLEYVVTQLDGNFALNSSDFFTEGYTLDFQYINPNVADVQVVNARAGNSRTGGIAGTLVLDSITHTIDCGWQGSVTSEVDQGFARTESQETVTGTITAQSFSTAVNEERHSVYQIYNGQSVNDMSRTINNTWQMDSVHYALTSGIIRKSFVDGVAAQLDSYWRAEGPLLREGVEIGGLGWGQQALSIEIWLDVAGERTVLEQHAAPQD